MACSCKSSNGQVTSVKQVTKRITKPQGKKTTAKKATVRTVLFRRPI